MRNARGHVGGRGGLAVLLAILALVVQTLAPVAAMAAQARGDVQTICVASGVIQATVKGGKPAPHKGFAGLPCQDCLAVAHAAIPAPASDATPVVHAVVHVMRPPAARFARLLARGPPRPPGQGPPIQIA